MTENVLITGGCGGLGSALASAWLARGATVAVADRISPARLPAQLRGAVAAYQVDVADAAANCALVDAVERDHGPLTTVVANAGVAGGGGLEAADSVWEEAWRVNVMAQVYLARAVVPRMLQRGGGRFLSVASAAGLLTNLGNAPYTATKHAAVAFAEWLAIEYGDAGLDVRLIAPMGVQTAMLQAGAGTVAGESVRALGVIPAAEAARRILQAVDEGEFLVLTHPQVARFESARVADRRAWLAGMRRARRRISAALRDGSA